MMLCCDTKFPKFNTFTVKRDRNSQLPFPSGHCGNLRTVVHVIAVSGMKQNRSLELTDPEGLTRVTLDLVSSIIYILIGSKCEAEVVRVLK